MRPGSILSLAVAALLAGAAVAVPVSALAARTAREANSQTFADSTGENPNAPDITSTVVSNDDAGLITFKVNIANRPSLTGDMAVVLYLDTDQQASTGDPTLGAEYAIELGAGAVAMEKWNGSDWDTPPSQTSLTYSYDTGGATIRVKAAELGGTKAFDFAAVALSGLATDASGNADFSHAQSDVSPDTGHGFFSYQVLTKLTLSVQAFKTSPTPAKAGKTLVASLAANESDTSGPVQAGTVTCSATVAGKHLAATAHRVANGVATCSWSVPSKAKGTLRGSVSLTVQDATVTRSFATTVK